MTPLYPRKRFLVFCLLSWLMLAACTNPTGNDGNGDEGGAISDYLRNLDYNPNELLNVQDIGGQDADREAMAVDTTSEQVGNFVRTCFRTEYNLKKNFDKVAILRPTNGIVWPGALVKGNRSLMDGVPEPISIRRSTLRLSVDLPGMGDNGIVEVDSPTNSNVQAGIDNALQWWNNNAYQEGYVNASNSSFSFTTAFSSEQLALDVDLNVEWAASQVSSQFDFTSSNTSNVVMAVYKQAFYSVNFDTPESPESVFDEALTLGEVQDVMDADAAPAYVGSVTYGRIIMFRMETSTSITNTSLDVESALKYASGLSVDLTLESEYQRILRNSSIEVVTIGGNAAVASEAVSAENAGDLLPIIQGENAVYSTSNPGVPIAYTVRYLKDNSLAKMGFTTDYVATECFDVQTRSTIRVYLDQFFIRRDCDGGLDGAGEFDLTAYVYVNGSRVGIHSADGSYDDGDGVGINREYIFNVDRADGNEFYVAFRSSEWDRNIWGDVFRDDRMNSRYGQITHDYSNGTFTNLPQPMTNNVITNGSGSCQAELYYTVDVLE